MAIKMKDVNVKRADGTENKASFVGVRLTMSERKALERRAQLMGLSISQYMRTLARQDVESGALRVR